MAEQTTTDIALTLAILIAREEPLHLWNPAEPGDLAIETSTRGTDPDSIGWVVSHGDAPWDVNKTSADKAVPMREVWDVKPLNPEAGPQSIEYAGQTVQRWDNADFRTVPSRVVTALGVQPPWWLDAAIRAAGGSTDG